MIFAFSLSLIGLFFLLINAILFFNSKKERDKVYLFLMTYLMIQFVVELFCNIIGFLYPNENLFLSHYYFVIQFILLSLFFNKVLINPVFKKLVFIILVLVLVSLVVQYQQDPSLYWRFNTYEIAVTSLPLILYCLIYFYENLRNTFMYHYFCVGLTFYLTSSCLIFLTGNTQVVFMTSPVYLDVWILNSLFFILFQFMVYKEWKLLKNISQ